MSSPVSTMPERIAHYRVLRRLGEGGMGVVYAAHDERLQRDVAIKMIRSDTTDAAARERLWREARAAASLNHPNICQLYDVGEVNGDLYIAMELLEGEPLATRIGREPMAVPEAAQAALGMLAALEAVHRRGLVHRDLKPSNVFIAPHGVKLLDFGLARLVDPGDATVLDVTRTGMLVGTPRYLAPEQFRGEPADARSDVYAAGAILFEMLSGKPAFLGNTLPQLVQAVMTDDPPILGGSPAIAAMDRIIHRALAKRPDRRYPSAEAMADDLRAALLGSDTGEVVRPHTVTRLIVLPFRMLRPDTETDFLAFSVPEAIACSLSSLGSLIVRSPVTAGRFGDTPDLSQIARQAEVDLALTGTLLRAGDQLRVVTQLVEVPEGTLRWSHTAQVPLGDVFQLQDSLSTGIVESLELPLSAPDQRLLRHDVPRSPKAYEYYLRANQLSLETQQWPVARDLYAQCLALDPEYAPAWARIGRIYRVIAALMGEDQEANFARAQEAFERALALNPDLPLAHNMLTYLEIDLGRSRAAMLRLLDRARVRGADPELFAGLVHACRYCGLLDASIAAHEHARRLDPNIRTSVHHAYLMRGDFERAVELSKGDVSSIGALALELMGRESEAIEQLRDIQKQRLPRITSEMLRAWQYALEGNRDESRRITDAALDQWTPRDPCTIYYIARQLARVGGTERALDLLGRALDAGYVCFSFMARDPWLDALRGDQRFTVLLRRAEQGLRENQAAFTAAGGERVLGLRA